MNIQKLHEKYQNTPLRKKDIAAAKKLIGEIMGFLDAKLDTGKRQYRTTVNETNLDKRLSAGEKEAYKNAAEFNILAIHQIVGSVADSLDECLDKWEKLEQYYKVTEGE
ncbi:hypothetical protein PXY30_004448 [Salmonella enterica]|nr:hypothetical protein [Salmonella enterica]